MKILKYKKRNNGIYDVFLEDRKLCLFEEVILEYNLLLTKEIYEEDLEEIEKDNLFWEVYHLSLRTLKGRYRSVFSLHQFLEKMEYPVEFIDKAIQKLIEQGYLNDRNYAKSYINSQILTTNHGPLKIQKALLEQGIDPSIVEDEMMAFCDDIMRDKIKKIIEKGIKVNHSKGGVILKNKIINDLKMEGYDLFLIQNVISDYSFSVDKDVYQKEYEKLYRRYSNKYQGDKLEYIIRQKLFQKGLGGFYEES